MSKSKLEMYRRDVYRALDEIEQEAVTVWEIADFVRWGMGRETTLHYVRDALRDMSMLGIIEYNHGVGGATIKKTKQFDKKMIRNPWVV